MIPYLKFYDTDCHLFANVCQLLPPSATNKTNPNAIFGIGQQGNAIYGL